MNNESIDDDLAKEYAGHISNQYSAISNEYWVMSDARIGLNTRNKNEITQVNSSD